MAVNGRFQPLLSHQVECLNRVIFGLSRPTAATSAFRGKADKFSTKTDIGQRMSAFGGKADLMDKNRMVLPRHKSASSPSVRRPWGGLPGGLRDGQRIREELPQRV
jgi:hypothetical protein